MGETAACASDQTTSTGQRRRLLASSASASAPSPNAGGSPRFAPVQPQPSSSTSSSPASATCPASALASFGGPESTGAPVSTTPVSTTASIATPVSISPLSSTPASGGGTIGHGLFARHRSYSARSSSIGLSGDVSSTRMSSHPSWPGRSTMMKAPSDGIPLGVQRLSPSPFIAPASSASINRSARSQPPPSNAVPALSTTFSLVRMLPCAVYEKLPTVPCRSPAQSPLSAPV